MPPKRTLSFHGEFWDGFSKLSVSHQAVATLVATLLTFTPIALLVWALIMFGQGNAEDPGSCKDIYTGNDRRLAVGFVGNSDFYGLGIRLGIYLQWLASLIANPLLKHERASMAGAYLTFSLAFAIAVLLLTFQRECAFTAEVIVVLDIFWGGTLLVMVPFVRLLVDIKTTGLGLALIPLMLSMLPVSAWFYFRLAFYGEVDFIASPGKGTFTFLLVKISPHGLHGVSVFLAVLSLVLCVIPVFSSLCLCAVLFLERLGQRPPEWTRTEPEKGTRVMFRELMSRIKNKFNRAPTGPTSQKWLGASFHCE